MKGIAVWAAIFAALVVAWPEPAEGHVITRSAVKMKTNRIVRGLAPWNRTAARWRVEYRRAWRAAERHRWSHCRPGQRPLITRRVTVKGQPASRHQRRVLTRGLRVGRLMGARRNTLVSYVTATTVEASAYNLPYGHGTSVGHLQLIDTHGSVAWRMRVENSARWYFRGAMRINRSRVLRPGDLAQAQQRSAYPLKYRRWEREARRTVALFLGPCRARVKR